MAAPAPRDAKRACPAALEARVSTTELPGLGKPGRVYSVLAGKGEERFLGTLSALYLQVHGRLALIAGHSSEPGFKDGEGDEARFNGISGMALGRGGSVLVSDSDNHSVRRVAARPSHHRRGQREGRLCRRRGRCRALPLPEWHRGG